MVSGYEVRILAPIDRTSVNFAELNCKVQPLPMHGKGTNVAEELLLFLRLYRAIQKIRPDVFLTFTVKPVVYGGLAARIIGIPTIPTVTGLGTAFINETWVTRVVGVLYRAGLLRAKSVLFQNLDDSSLFVKRRFVKEDQVAQLPGSGIDLKKFLAVPTPSTKDRDVTIFLMIGRMLWDKGVGEFVKAAEIVKQANPNTEFQLLGELGSDNATAISIEEINIWQQKKIITYLGETDDVRNFIEEADCVVLPSYREGLPRTLLEAGAMGRPVLTTRAVGCKDVVEDGITGLLCNPRDAVDLANKMEVFLDLTQSEKTRMGREGRKKVAREFDEQIVIHRYKKIIAATVNSRK